MMFMKAKSKLSKPPEPQGCAHPPGILCPKCGGKTRVPHTRAKNTGIVLRYRVCIRGCPGSLVTRETIIKFPG